MRWLFEEHSRCLTYDNHCSSLNGKEKMVNKVSLLDLELSLDAEDYSWVDNVALGIQSFYSDWDGM